MSVDTLIFQICYCCECRGVEEKLGYSKVDIIENDNDGSSDRVMEGCWKGPRKGGAADFCRSGKVGSIAVMFSHTGERACGGMYERTYL